MKTLNCTHICAGLLSIPLLSIPLLAALGGCAEVRTATDAVTSSVERVFRPATPAPPSMPMPLPRLPAPICERPRLLETCGKPGACC